MRTIALLLVGVMLTAVNGCSLFKRSAPEPTKEQIVLHGIVEFNKSDVQLDSIPVIQEAAAKLKEQGNLGVVVEGHSDSTGNFETNQKLSLRRAEAVRDCLVRLGVDRGRIVAIGKGASEPIATNATPEGRALNRRVVVTVYQP